jgi:hypothetical protein
MLLFLNELPNATAKEELNVARHFLGRCPLVALLSKSDRVYRVVAIVPARHGYPPQVTIETPSGLPLVVDVPLPEDTHLDAAA